MDTKQRSIHRLKIVRGHVDKVIRMVEAGDYCIDVLTQSQAIQGALKEVDTLILENHLQTCVTDAVLNNKRDQAIAEVVKVFRRAN
ncbi:MAG: metal-sensitive transcriptional regulator [bacterium]|nr:metal-sensitive transcriptional regulator [bacterium]